MPVSLLNNVEMQKGLLGAKPGAPTAMVPSPGATAATPSQLPSAPKIVTASERFHQHLTDSGIFGMPGGTNADVGAARTHSTGSFAKGAPNMSHNDPISMPNVPFSGEKCSEQRKLAQKIAGFGQTMLTAGKGALRAAAPGAILGAAKGALDPNDTIVGGAARGAVGGALLGGAMGGTHAHLMQAPGGIGKAYQQGVGWAQKQYGDLKTNLMQPPAAASVAKVGSLQEFFAKIASGKPWSAAQTRLQGAWDAHNAAATKGPVQTHVPLTNPNDMGRANMLSAFASPGGYHTQPAPQATMPSSGLELDKTPKPFEYGVNQQKFAAAVRI